MDFRKRLFDPLPVEIAGHLSDPTAIVASVSGGLDSDQTALALRQAYPENRIILWHARLDKMDWPETEDHLDRLAEVIGNAERVTVQAVYELTGGQTPTGYNSTKLRRVHDVSALGPATDDDPNAITNLLDFAERARNGMPPTKKVRYCTSYFKTAVFDSWLVRNRDRLGPRTVIGSGERWTESTDRSRLPRWEWRGNLASTHRRPAGWQAAWIRPVIDLRFHQIVRGVVDSGIDPHPGYGAQGETLNRMLDPWRDEKGRARLSCVCCIFSRGVHLRTARTTSPASVTAALDAVQAFENRTGKSWRQGEFHQDLVAEKERAMPLFLNLKQGI